MVRSFAKTRWRRISCNAVHFECFFVSSRALPSLTFLLQCIEGPAFKSRSSLTKKSNCFFSSGRDSRHVERVIQHTCTPFRQGRYTKYNGLRVSIYLCRCFSSGKKTASNEPQNRSSFGALFFFKWNNRCMSDVIMRFPTIFLQQWLFNDGCILVFFQLLDSRNAGCNCVALCESAWQIFHNVSLPFLDLMFQDKSWGYSFEGELVTLAMMPAL